MEAGQSPDLRSSSFLLAGVDVIENGLPPLPDSITYDITIPISYWTAPRSAVVVFFRFSKNPDLGEIRPLAMEIPYYMEAGKWAVKTSGAISGSGFPFDPVTQPGFADDLDGNPIVYGSLDSIRPEGKAPVWVARGRASRDVAYIAIVQDGVEDRRRLDSHFGSWVVCTEVQEPFEVVAFDGSGQSLARLPHPFRPGLNPDFS